MIKKKSCVTKTIGLIMAFAVMISFGAVFGNVKASADVGVAYDIDAVYSSYDETDYAYGPVYAGRSDALSVYGLQGTGSKVGITTSFSEQVTLSSSDVLVVKLNIYNYVEREWVFEINVDGTLYAASGDVALYRGDAKVSALGFGTSGYPMRSSAGYNKTALTAVFDTVVIPFSSFGATEGSATLSDFRFSFAGGTSFCPKFNLYSVSVAKCTEDVLSDVNTLWTPSGDNWAYNDDTLSGERLCAQYLTAGQLYLEDCNLSSSNKNSRDGKIVFKLPDVLIGEDGLVDITTLKGLVFDFEGCDVTTDVVVSLFSDIYGTTVACNTVYKNYKKQYVANSGAVSVKSSKYWSANEKGLYYYAFTASTDDTADTTETFYGSLSSGKISPYFMLTVPKGAKYTGKCLTIKSIRVITDDTLYSVETGKGVSANRTKGYVGTDVVIGTTLPESDITGGSINEVAMTENQLAAIVSSQGYAFSLVGNAAVSLNYTERNPEADLNAKYYLGAVPSTVTIPDNARDGENCIIFFATLDKGNTDKTIQDAGIAVRVGEEWRLFSAGDNINEEGKFAIALFDASGTYPVCAYVSYDDGTHYFGEMNVNLTESAE